MKLTTDIERTGRVRQVEGMFDVPPADRQQLDIALPELPQPGGDWGVGLIAGPSGSGKSTVARATYNGGSVEYVGPAGFEWPERRAIVDVIGGPVRDAVGLLTAVGLGSPPAWLRPFRALSTGEQFRANMARALAVERPLIVVDEFTSVVDRQVAQVASHAVQKAVRRADKQLVAVTCHWDVLDWLQPDWVYRPDTESYERRERLRRPQLDAEVCALPHSAWRPFSRHHYLSPVLHGAAKCFGLFVADECVAFNAYIPFPHPHVDDIRMGHRLVVLPDWQGLGIGLKFDNWLGEWLHGHGYRYHKTISHPALIHAYATSPRWRVLTAQNRPNRTGAKRLHKTSGNLRKLATRSFSYVPEGAGNGSARTPSPPGIAGPARPSKPRRSRIRLRGQRGL